MIFEARQGRENFHGFQRFLIGIGPARELVQVRSDACQLAEPSFLFRSASQTQAQTGLPDVVRNAHAVESSVQLEQVALFRMDADDNRR